ncbi:MAG: pyrroloquinoline quinone biosynthesis protein PqqB [Gammaproteobacteria bacterium]|nr:MAG: pyrroloquinoline quinone biosynthesis protein PqqB [Gammaproteobacteria bacterium]
MKNKYVLFLLLFTLSLGFKAHASAENNTPYLYILGVVQDAGYPQTGCYKKHCMPGWNDPSLRRGAVSLALIDPSLNKKYMFEATPNFPEQLYQLEVEAPSDRFQLGGIFLTHAHMGHYAGLMFLGHEAMGASNIKVFAMPLMLEYLSKNGPWEQLVKYKNIALVPLTDSKPQDLGSLKVTPFLVPHRDEYSETVGYRIEGPSKTAIFIPDINKWSLWKTDLAKLVKSVDYALIDASFYNDKELPGRDMSKIPHPFVVESMELLKNLTKKQRNKVWFIHMNHTNPLLITDSEQSKLVRDKGFNIAKEGIKLGL